ncbi:ribose/xylose/arabinose/galactoside ABC-type transport system protein [Dinoroseobacter shibae DFL 12 = DSM 16493]|jgi:simple sugar transport system permease protein|uniref:Ribose/xylose/arabinose/galactoside ABC-type transport system protein n=1 Tax=Dinoroseobacter shibae (strain DSM 16493 / NCIMB 14021 / DFL 12) TaxID=398580 RepID=A8LNW7_DINSH|nr:ABC transporter permease [Dinoroseobacter shibae]ABV92275.1 ribose/xylose/arabinose/galactoside ABC-type transport system protein [Dinoroseobacter shibae DFL 12 = DSM 16493]URF47229.1 ABC transporter permease [Dinoroseobacter shibae]URF51540.1 ABC transporter permease [Dinoroseobacter shibae]
MTDWLPKDFWTRNETLVAGVIMLFCFVATVSDPRFLTITTVSDLLRASIVIGILAVGAMLVLVSGGIDVSFTAIAVFAMYSSTVLSLTIWPEIPWPVIFVISVVFGAALGAINGFFIAFLGLPTLIVTLGTLSIFRGFLLTFIGSQRISDLPPSMRDFSRGVIARGTTEAGNFYSIPWAALALLFVIVLTWFILKKTMLGRSIYAIGGSVESARRIGINVKWTQFFVYVYVGALAGLAGIIHGSVGRMADPFSLVGLELSVIAAVVLGGARLIGGYGTLTGTMLGVALIVIVQNSLIVIGIPTTWQSVTIGILILLGTGVPAYRAKRAAAQAG